MHRDFADCMHRILQGDAELCRLAEALDALRKRLVFSREGLKRMAGNRNELCSQRVLIAVLCLLLCLLVIRNANHGSRNLALRIRNALFLRRAVEKSRVNVAELLNFLKRHAVLHELLLCLHNLRRLDRVELLAEIFANGFQRLSLAEALQIALQRFRALRLCVREIILRSRRHRRLCRSARRRGRCRRHRRFVHTYYLKALLPKRLQNLLHRDALHPGSLRNRHNLACGSEYLRFRDLLKTDTRHNLLELRVLRCKLVHCLSEINYLIHGCASPMVCFSLLPHYNTSSRKNRDRCNKTEIYSAAIPAQRAENRSSVSRQRKT